MDEDVVTLILNDLKEVADRPLTPTDIQDLKDALFESDAVFSRVLESDRSYFVTGSYNPREEQRLLAVKQALAGRRVGDHAFLMKDVPAFTSNFVLKFHVLIRRTDVVVGVFEHNRGGHEWEAGALSEPSLRRKTWILKRKYATEKEEREAFDAMLAHFFELIDEHGHLLHWRTDTELIEHTESEIP
ncbi:hypothetical protein [Natronorarus salvus]|uniref:hypothetical protein n=1 Tax=Natronorarus salvus TaxID=3117733 RepID=UPI002F26D3E4